MNKKLFSFIFVSLLVLSTTLKIRLIPLVVAQTKTENYISVPYHGQIGSVYCGPACLEMIFDYYGEDVPQHEIAEAAGTTSPWGTYTDEMRRAAHFSNLSTSSGTALPGNITGYSTRQLGYAAFERFSMTIGDLKTLIDNGYPIIVLTSAHYRLVIGYNPTNIIYHDPWSGPNGTMNYESFLAGWEYSSYWGLFVCPWKITQDTPSYGQRGTIFNVTVNITYPCPPPFSAYDYAASSCNATIMLSPELSLAPGETSKKTLDVDYFAAGTSTTVSWEVKGEGFGTQTLSILVEGKVSEEFFPYNYEDRIGGSANITVLIDLTGDGIVDIYDITIFANAFGSKPDWPNWDPIADVVPDEVIDIFDLVKIAVNFGKTI